MEPKDLEAEGGGEEVRVKSWMEMQVEHRVVMSEVQKIVDGMVEDSSAG